MSANLATILTDTAEKHGDKTAFKLDDVELSYSMLDEGSARVAGLLKSKGLAPGDRWCVVAARWLQAYQAGVAAPVVLASTHERALEVVPLEALREHAVDVPDDPGSIA